MSYLLYAIVHGDRAEPHQPVRFLGYPRASIQVRAAGLGAVTSALSAADGAPDVARLLVYSKVIEAYNGERAVIPMRYGCRFASLADIGGFLARKQELFVPLLRELDGSVEMSLRVADCESHGDACELLTPAGAPSGIRYLAERRRHYDAIDGTQAKREEIHEQARAMAAGTFSRSLAESSISAGESILAIHFLVRRERVSDFRRAMEPLTENSDPTAALTGPWPPYNFVSARSRERMR